MRLATTVLGSLAAAGGLALGLAAPASAGGPPPTPTSLNGGIDALFQAQPVKHAVDDSAIGTVMDKVSGVSAQTGKLLGTK
ncbi:hypothetical protein [Streptomyces tsukubensis]|uniref:Secreted protein n=1 Tax=Streptomyces tsukubensis TaxID=83656 RepID=A0A1V4AAK0_9ACTN|nr:hypothetical protein [Streptomyces tsukubensis]OON80103.1 hypothetical protein B1H18_13075 [Streptomyces tsukubensis]QFR97333.1 hypothetical protein GBW32_35045 [Streptomyces tsukubensis]